MNRPSLDRPRRGAGAFAALAAVVLAAAGCKSVPPPDPATLDASIAAGREFLLRHQTERGDFTYEYDAASDETTLGGSQVRQAGALWALALLHRESPTPETRAAVEKGLAFWESSSTLVGNRRVLAYPGDTHGEVGTVALVALAAMDFLAAPGEPTPDQFRWKRMTLELLSFLVSLRRPDGQFPKSYRLTDGAPLGDPSPYFDGEALLAMAKGAKQQDVPRLRALALQSAEQMYRVHVVEALAADRDSAQTKGFYQWGSMAFFELHDAGWDPDGVWAKRTIDLAHWMVDVHRTLTRRRNTAYAQEGIVVAYELAKRTGDEASAKKLKGVVEKGLGKLITWQIGGPRPNGFAARHADDERAQGGVMNAKDDAVLRIDVTQHQMHAALLARRYVWPG